MLPSFLKSILLRLPLLFFVGLFLFQFSFVQKYAVNLPYVDEWSLIYGDNHPASISARWLYEQVNDHRTTTTKLFVWLQYHLNGWNLRTHQIISYFVFGTTLVALVLFARKFVPQVAAWIVLAFMLFLLSPIIWIEHVNAYAIAIHFWLLFLLLSAYFFFDETQRWKALTLASASSILSMYSFAAGFVTSLVLLVVFVLFKTVRAVGLADKRASRRELLQMLVVALVIGGALFVWILRYHKPAYVGPIMLPHRMAFWSFFLNLLSFSFGIDRLSRSLGAFCLLLILVPMIGVIWNRRGKLSNGQWAVFGLALAILADLSAISLGRISFTLSWTKVAEYPEHGMPLILLTALSWSMFLQDRKRLRIAFLTVFWIFCVLTFSNNWDFGIYARTGMERAANFQCVQKYYEQSGDGHCRGTFADYPYPEIVLEQGKRLNVSFYREMNRAVRERTGSDIPRRSVYFGSYEIDCRQVRGWAMDLSDPNSVIEVSIYDGDSLLTTLHANLPRPDVRKAGHGTGQYGFEFTVPASLKDGRPHLISVRSSGGRDLRDAPKSLTCEAPEPSP